jgi:hypothetical protein
VHYQLVYDAGAQGFEFPWDALLGLAPLALGLAVLRFPALWFPQRPRFGRVLGTFVIGFGLILLVGIPTGKWREYQEFRDRLQQKNYALVEGTVTEFVPGAVDGHPMESFAVNDRKYMYSPYTSSGFSTIAAQGGPIRSGLHVRIADVNGNIARLEIAR